MTSSFQLTNSKFQIPKHFRLAITNGIANRQSLLANASDIANRKLFIVSKGGAS